MRLLEAKRCMLVSLKLGADFSRRRAGKRIGHLLFVTHPHLPFANRPCQHYPYRRRTQYRDFRLAVFDYFANSVGVISWAPAYTVQCGSMTASFTTSPTDLGEHRTRLASESATTKQLGDVPDLRFCQSNRLVPTVRGCGVQSSRESNGSGPQSCRASSGHPRSAKRSLPWTTGPSDLRTLSPRSPARLRRSGRPVILERGSRSSPAP